VLGSFERLVLPLFANALYLCALAHARSMLHTAILPAECVAILRQHEMVLSMSQPAHPYDNAGCESFIKALKREEIYANEYANLEELIERYHRCGGRRVDTDRSPVPKK
jgi:transposase InsO family protein